MQRLQKLFFVIGAWFLLYLLAAEGEIRRNTPLKRLVDSCFLNASKCCFGPGEEPWIQATPRCAFNTTTQSYPCSIKLGINDWDNTFANVYVAKIFIEEFLGYPVEIRAEYDDFNQFGSENSGISLLADMWDELRNGTIDAILEVWEIGKESEINEFIVQEESIVNAGPLGVIGAIGWFLPTHILSNDTLAPLNLYECTEPAFFEYWRSLESPGVVDIFGDPSPTRTCCLDDIYSNPAHEFPCIAAEELGGTPVSNGGFATPLDCVFGTQYPNFGGRFLDGAATWTQYDDQIIRNLGFNLTVQYAGTQQALIDEATKAAAEGRGLLFYYWEPNALFQRVNLSRVLLPRHTRTCWDTRDFGGVDCDYPQELLFKMYRAALEEAFPDVSKFIERMQFTENKDQEDILADVYYNGLDFPTAACNWVRSPANRDKWTPWIETMETLFNDTVWPSSPPSNRSVVCDCANGMRPVVKTLAASSDPLVNVQVDSSPCTDASFSTYSTRWTQYVQPTTLDFSIGCSYVEVDSTVSIALLIIALISLLTNVIFFVLLTLYRKNKFIVASNYITLSTFLLGCMLLNVYPLTNISPPTSLSCTAKLVGLIYGYIWFIGSLIVKLYVLYNVFMPLRRASRWNSRRLKYQPIFNFFVASLLLAIWAGVVSFTPEPLEASAIVGLEAGGNVQLLQCPRNEILEQLFALFAIVLIVICVYMSYQTRHIAGAFSEARFNALTGYNLVVFGFFAFFVVQNAGALTPPEQVLYIGIAIAWVTLSSSVLIVGTRLYAAIMGFTFDAQEAIMKSRVTRHARIGNVRDSQNKRNGSADSTLSIPRRAAGSSKGGSGTNRSGSGKGTDKSSGRKERSSSKGEGSRDSSKKSLSTTI